MRVLGKPLTETAPGRLEWLMWVGPLRSNCLLRLNETCKGETVTTISTATEGNNKSCTYPCVVKCMKSYVRWILSGGCCFCFPLVCSVCSLPFLILYCPALYCQSPFFIGKYGEETAKLLLSVARQFPAFLIDLHIKETLLLIHLFS